MAIGYRLDRRLALTVTVFDGKVTGEEWSAAARAVFADPAWPPGRLNLTDLRTADASALTIADRASIFEINARQAHKLVGMKSAAVGGTHFEAARRFERDDLSSGLRIIPFDMLEPACAWLGIDTDDAAAIINEVRRELRTPGTATADAGTDQNV
jgi:hypothetical protein